MEYLLRAKNCTWCCGDTKVSKITDNLQGGPGKGNKHTGMVISQRNTFTQENMYSSER